MTLSSRPPRVHRGSALPPGVPPPKKGELHLRVEGFEWQNMVFEARLPACCGLLISWWGQTSYNSLLMPLSASLASSPATAVFSVHSNAKRFERYLQDMGFLELTLVNGNTTFDLKDVSRTMLGKLSVSVSSLTEGHPVRGSYPIFANGHRLIGSLTLSITVTFYNCTSYEDVGKLMVKSNRRQTPSRENTNLLAVSSFKLNEELASTVKILPLYPLPSDSDSGREPTRRDLNVISYSTSNSEQSSGSPLMDQEVKLSDRSLQVLKSSTFDQTMRKIVRKRLSCTKSSLSSESQMTLSTVPDVDSSPLQLDNEIDEIGFPLANPYLDPSYCELDSLKAEKADSPCGSDDSSLSCVITKSAHLMKSLACESGRRITIKPANLSCSEKAPKNSYQLQDQGKIGHYGANCLVLERDHDLSTTSREGISRVGRLDDYSSAHKSNVKNNTDMRNSYGKQSSDLTTSETIRNLRSTSKDSAQDACKESEERNPQNCLRAPQLCTDEAQRGGLSNLLLPQISGIQRSTCYINNLFENPTNTTNLNVWRDKERVADELIPKGVSVVKKNNSEPLRHVSSGTQPPWIPKVDFGFDPGGKRNPPTPSISIPGTKANNLACQLIGGRTDPTDFLKLEGPSCFSMQRPFQPKTSIGFEPGNRKPYSPCSSPQTVIDDIKQLIRRAEACQDTLKKPEYPKTRLMAPSPIPSAESIRLSRSHSGHSLGLNSSSDDLLANILAVKDNGRDSELPTKVHQLSEDLDLAEDIDDATDVMTAALLEALYVDNDKTANASSAVEPASSKARHQEAETCRIEDYWHDNYLQSLGNELKNSMNWSRVDELNTTKHGGMSFGDQYCLHPAPQHNQPFNFRVTIGKLVLCGPMVRDLADCRPSKGPLMHPTCTCSLTVSFPALVPPYSSKQRICISPVSFGTREAVFDHQSQLLWNTLPGHDLQEWQSRDLRVAVLLTWQRFDTMECAGYVSLEKVVTSMPGVYRTSLALVLTSHLAHKRSRSRSPSNGRNPKKSGKYVMKPGLKHPVDASKRNGSENSERLASAQKDAVARADVVLQLCHGIPLLATKHEPFEETRHTGTKRLSSKNALKPLDPRVLTNSAPIVGRSQDWWLHVIVHDVVNCFENVLSSPHYTSNMKVRAPHLLLVVKSNSGQIAQAPFPQKFGLCNHTPGKSTGSILPAPKQLLKSSKAVLFIEVWHDAAMASNADLLRKPPRLLVGLIEAPLTLATSILSLVNCHCVYAKGSEIVAEGLHQVFDTLQCKVVGTVMITVTLGSSQQVHQLWKENKAATLIQRRVREFLTKELGAEKSIEITRFWDTKKNPKAS